MLMTLGAFLYYLIWYFYSNEQISTLLFITASLLFIRLILFELLGIKSIERQKQYIERLSAFYEETT